jgi:hypothetical protein
LFETSERSWHGFEEIRVPRGKDRVSRRSLAIYMYTRERPLEETAPAHSTFYVGRQLPFVPEASRKLSLAEYDRIGALLERRKEHLAWVIDRDRARADRAKKALLDRLAFGLPLSPLDVELVRNAFGREDRLLKHLYEREKGISTDMASVVNALNESHRPIIPTFGAAELAGPPVGYYEDQWAGPVLELDFLATGDARTLTLRGHLSGQFVDGQHLTCTVGEESYVTHFGAGAFDWAMPVSVAAGQRFSAVVTAAKSLVPDRDIPGSSDDRALSYMLFAADLT